MTLTHVTILIGEGLSLFGPPDKDIALQHVSSRTFPSGLVGSTYRISLQNA